MVIILFSIGSVGYYAAQSGHLSYWEIVFPYLAVGSGIILQWFLTIFFSSFLYHRYWTHESFTMSKLWASIFKVMAFIFLGPSFYFPRAWIVMHLLHHTHSDTQQDPHSPRYALYELVMAWNMKVRHGFLAHFNPYFSREKKERIVKHYLNKSSLPWYYSYAEFPKSFWDRLPKATWFDRFASSAWTRISWNIVYLFLYALLLDYILVHNLPLISWIPLLCLPIHSFIGAIQGTLVNWYGHLKGFGYRNYQINDDSTNILRKELALGGEGFQNNHHHDPKNPNFAHKAGEIDPTFFIIKILSRLGIVHLKT